MFSGFVCHVSNISSYVYVIACVYYIHIYVRTLHEVQCFQDSCVMFPRSPHMCVSCFQYLLIYVCHSVCVPYTHIHICTYIWIHVYVCVCVCVCVCMFPTSHFVVFLYKTFSEISPDFAFNLLYTVDCQSNVVHNKKDLAIFPHIRVCV